jgi:class 3 adenylate cyclase
MLVLFRAADDAVGYALAYHRAIAALDVPLKARAGLHVGAVLLRENSAADVALGCQAPRSGRNREPTAARVMSIARAGQTLLTDDARSALKDLDLRCARMATGG